MSVTGKASLGGAVLVGILAALSVGQSSAPAADTTGSSTGGATDAAAGVTPESDEPPR